MPYNRPIPNSRSRQKSSSGIETLVQAEKLMQIALLLPSAALIGWLMGAWADSKLHTSWLGLVGIVFGGVSGLVYVVRMVLSTKPGSDGGGGAKADSEKGDSNDTQ
jgi:F0F1-type ATP synthase assembly protein I